MNIFAKIDYAGMSAFYQVCSCVVDYGPSNGWMVKGPRSTKYYPIFTLKEGDHQLIGINLDEFRNLIYLGISEKKRNCLSSQITTNEKEEEVFTLFFHSEGKAHILFEILPKLYSHSRVRTYIKQSFTF